MGIHALPGFTSLAALRDFQITPDSGWHALTFEADKPIAGLFLLVTFREELASRARVLFTAVKPALPALVIGLAAVYVLSLLLGFTKPDLSVHFFIVLWFLRNLTFTVVAEELLFRGVIQREIAERLTNHFKTESLLWIPILAIGVAGILFGVAHVGGGWSYALLATLAGVVYGYGYWKTKRLEVPIIAHVLLNTGHIVFFSYG